MSHFITMVTNVDEFSLEEQLEPFYEQGQEGDYFMEKDYYLENNTEEIDKWLKNELEFIDKQIAERDDIKWWETQKNKLTKISHAKTNIAKLKEIQKYEGGGLDTKGLYWISNPNAKWDWWVEGGRWDGWLITKDGKKCNHCLVKDIDFDKMKQSIKEDRAEYYDKEMKRIEGTEYKPCFWGYGDRIPTREEYIEKDSYIAPYALLHNGKWYEKGEMGWWGIDDPKYEEKDWEEKFFEIFNGLDLETEVAIVDCHI